MFDIEQFEAEYAAAANPTEQFEVLKKGLNAYARAVGVAVAEFMDTIEAEDYAEAYIISNDMAHSLAAMATGLQVVAILQKMRGAR